MNDIMTVRWSCVWSKFIIIVQENNAYEEEKKK